MVATPRSFRITPGAPAPQADADASPGPSRDSVWSSPRTTARVCGASIACLPNVLPRPFHGVPSYLRRDRNVDQLPAGQRSWLNDQWLPKLGPTETPWVRRLTTNTSGILQKIFPHCAGSRTPTATSPGTIAAGTNTPAKRRPRCKAGAGNRYTNRNPSPKFSTAGNPRSPRPNRLRWSSPSAAPTACCGPS